MIGPVSKYYTFDVSDVIENTKQKRTSDLHWFVLDFSNGGIYLLDVIPLIKRDMKWRDLKINTFDRFSKEMFNIVMYLFHGRSQFECCITDNVPHIDKEEIDRLIKDREEHPNQVRYGVNLSWGNEIDVAFQIISNWDAFIDYLWTHKKELLK